MTRMETDFDSETDFIEIEEPKEHFKTIHIEEDEDDVDDNYPNFAQNAQFYVSEAHNESKLD